MKIVYPGSFDPFTNGHLDILQRSVNIFDHVTVAVVENINKNPIFSLEERKTLAERVIKDSSIDSNKVSVVGCKGLLVDLLDQLNIHNVLRGVRLISDFETEMKLALNNKSLSKKVETIFLFTNPIYTHISSSVVKEIFSLGGDISQYVPLCIKQAMTQGVVG